MAPFARFKQANPTLAFESRPTRSPTCQTGNENSIDRLMKQIQSFMTEISDEFKIVVIDAIRLVAFTLNARRLCPSVLSVWGVFPLCDKIYSCCHS
jgi:hypothetical protein